MHSSCQVDHKRELAHPSDKPFKATPYTYINRAYSRLFYSEEERERQELFKQVTQETAALERKMDTWWPERAAQQREMQSCAAEGDADEETAMDALKKTKSHLEQARIAFETHIQLESSSGRFLPEEIARK